MSAETPHFYIFVNQAHSQRNHPANTGHSLYAVSMLGQRRRRWANIETELCESPVFSRQVVVSTATCYARQCRTCMASVTT